MFDEFLSFCREYGVIESYDQGTLSTLFEGLEEKERGDE